MIEIEEHEDRRTNRYSVKNPNVRRKSQGMCCVVPGGSICQDVSPGSEGLEHLKTSSLYRIKVSISPWQSHNYTIPCNAMICKNDAGDITMHFPCVTYDTMFRKMLFSPPDPALIFCRGSLSLSNPRPHPQQHQEPQLIPTLPCGYGSIIGMHITIILLHQSTEHQHQPSIKRVASTSTF